jgi:hypothetical protein
MKYFVNVYIDSYGQAGQFYIYFLYSGESIDSIKEMIVSDVKTDYDFIDGIIALDPSDYANWDMSDLSINLIDMVDEYIDLDYGDLNSFEIKISEPYTHLSKAIGFYNEFSEFSEESEDDLTSHEECYFNLRGDYAESMGNVFPYLYSISKDFRVKISTSFANNIYQLIK